jgi:hypothetical protein
MEKLVITPQAAKGVRALPTRPPVRPSLRSPAGRAAATGELVLDHCARCGGVWFEAGEVQRLRSCEAELLWREAIAEESGVKMPSFFGYMAYSGLILVPLFGIVTLLFFR